MSKKTSVWVLLLLLAAGVAVAQYSGTYTIMPSGGDFASHAEAADSLMTYGVVGPCTLEMYTGTYDGQAYLSSASWDSVEVIFKAASGQSPIVQYTSYPWYIYYTNNITVDGITTISTGSYGAYVYYSDRFKMLNCNISSGSYGMYLYYSDTTEVSGCNISSGSYGLMWYYSTRRKIVGNDIKPSSYGLYMYNSSSQYAYYDSIVNNMIYSPSGYAVYGYYSYYRYWAYNTIYGITSYGMYDYYAYNKTYLCNIFSTQATSYCIYTYGSVDSSDYNCWYTNGSSIIYQSGAYTFATWQSAGYDPNGMNADPQVGGPANLHLKTASPCRDSGVAITAFPLDIDGDTIHYGVRDIGADEYTTVGSPMSGVYLIHWDPDSGDYSSFGEAIGDMVLRGYAGNITFNVAAGTYNENITLTAMGNGSYHITFQARGDGEVVLQAAGSYAVNLITAARFRFVGLTVQGASYGFRLYYTSGSSPYKGCDSIVVKDCEITGNSYGIYMYYGVDDCSIVGNDITANSSYGIYMRGQSSSTTYRCRRNVFANNLIQNWSSYGLYFYYHDYTKLVFNTIYGRGSYGFYDYYGYNETFHGNIFNGNTYGWYKYYGTSIPTASNYNCFNGGTAAIRHNSGGTMTLAQWQTYSSRDAQSIQANPLCISATDAHLRPQSPCRDTSINYTGFPLDVDGDTRTTPRTDIGADDFQLTGSPLSGTFLIHQDPDSGDYNSFEEATYDLSLWGTSGACVFNVAGDTYYEAVRIGDIYGGYPVTFQARGYGTSNKEQVVISAYNQDVVVLTGAEYVTFQGFEVYMSGTSGYSGIELYYSGSDGCDWCVIRDNKIHAYYGVYMYYYTNHCSIIGNITDGSGYYGMYSYGNSGNRNLGNVLINNMLVGTGYGLMMYYHDSTKAIYNSWSGTNYYGQYDYYGYYSHYQNTIRKGGNYGWYKYYGSAIPVYSDYNCFYGGSYGIYHSSYGGLTLAQWQSYSSRDANSIEADPLFAGANNLHLRTQSPCRDSALAVTGITVDADGDARDSDPDIGADEWRSPGPPLAGIYYIHPDEDSGDFVSFLEGLDQLSLRGFGGHVTFRGYTGTYSGELNLAGLGNDTFRLTFDAVSGETPVVTSSTNYAFYMPGADNITIDGLTINGYYAIYMYYSGSQGCDNCVITNNVINAGYMGIYFYYYGDYNVFAGNEINCTSSYGIYSYGNSSNRPTGNMVYNNMIRGATSYAIYSYYHDSLTVAYNSMLGSASSGYGNYFGYHTNLTMMNNISVNLYSYTYATAYRNYNSSGVWDYNCGYAPNSSYYGYLSGSYVSFSGWQGGGLDSNGINADPYYVSASDLHIQDSSPCLGAGYPLPHVTTVDFDGQARSPGTPAIGADDYPSDIAVDVILAPTGIIARLVTVTPQVVVRHVDGPNAGGNLIMAFDTAGTVFWQDTSAAFMLTPGQTDTVDLPDFTPQFSYTGINATCWHTGTPDTDPSNDTAVGTFDVGIIDVEVLRINVPAGQIVEGTVIYPEIVLRNNGPGDQYVFVAGIIDDYTDGESSVEIGEVNLGSTSAELGDEALVDGVKGTVPMKGEADAVVWSSIQGATVPSLDTVVITYAVSWTASPSGTYFCRFWHGLATDEDRSNDTLQHDFDVMTPNADVGITQIVAPAAYVDTMTWVTPELACRNYNSSDPVTFMAYVDIYDPYTDSLYGSYTAGPTTLGPGASGNVVFGDSFNVMTDTGYWNAYCSLYVAGDIQPGNNVMSREFLVAGTPPFEPGWHEMSSMPLSPSGKPVKRGAWAALHSDGLIYVTKGYKTTDFYSYDPTTDLWDTLSGMPYTSHPMWFKKVPRKGSKGVSDMDNTIYVTQGNNSLGFWSYDVTKDSWSILPDVPLGTNRKKVKGGTDMVYVTGDSTDYVYLLKGYKTEFYRFDINAQAWETLEDAPIGVRNKWDKGSWLAYDGMTPKIYGHKAKYHELYAYDLDSLKWGPALSGMPFIGMMGRKKKSKDGGSADWFGGEIYAIKGGNTQELWTYNPATDTWTELDTIPAYGSTGRKKRIKYGADIVHWSAGTFFTLKGNKTSEWWRYTIDFTAYQPPRRSGVMGDVVKTRQYGITVTPNPLSGGRAYVRFALPKSGPLTLSVFDISGRTVDQQTVLAGRNGSATLDLRSLSAGVYLVKLEAGEFTDTRKLVVNH